MRISARKTCQFSVCTGLLVGGMLLGMTAPAAVDPDMPEPVLSQSHPELVKQTWRHARLQALCESMVGNILKAARHHPSLAAVPREQRDRVVLQYQRFATAKRFELRLRDYLAQTPASALRAMITLTQSAIGQRALLEEARFATVAPAVMQQYRDALSGQADGPGRIRMIRRLDTAIGVTDIALTVAGASLYGTRLALVRHDRVDPYEGPKPHAPDISPTATSQRSQLNQLVRTFIAQMRPVQQQHVETTYLYLYRHLTLDELTAYVAQYEREPVRSLQRRLVEALGAEMIAIQSDVIRAVIRAKDQVGTTEI